jgi:ATP-binding cassette subfamily F protein 3
LKKRLAHCEQALETLQDQRRALQEQLADSDLYQAENKDRLTELLKQKAALDQQIEDAELEWLRAADAVETAEKEAASP